MHDLIAREPGALGEPLLPEIEAARRYVDAAQAANTERAYRQSWGDFTVFCAFRQVAPLPAHPAVVALFLAFCADRGLSASSIGQRAAAIAHRHRKAGHDAPTTNPVVQDALRGIRRTIGTAPRHKSAAATAERIRAILAAIDASTMIGIRDRALLALGFAGAFRRSELVALQVADLEEVADGYRVTIRRSKTDQTGEGAEIVIPRGLKIRPVAAVQAWLQAAQITGGPLSASCTATCVPAGSVGLLWHGSSSSAPKLLGSIRQRSALTACARDLCGASILKIQETSRHKSTDVLAGYVRREDLFRDHAGAGFL